jgi:hypothetical protein
MLPASEKVFLIFSFQPLTLQKSPVDTNAFHIRATENGFHSTEATFVEGVPPTAGSLFKLTHPLHKEPFSPVAPINLAHPFILLGTTEVSSCATHAPEGHPTRSALLNESHEYPC